MSRDPEEIRTEIDQTREELADTAAALAHKTDVKARAKERVQGIKADIAEKTPSSAQEAGGALRRNPGRAIVIAAAIAGFAVGYVIAKRRD